MLRKFNLGPNIGLIQQPSVSFTRDETVYVVTNIVLSKSLDLPVFGDLATVFIPSQVDSHYLVGKFTTCLDSVKC